MLEIRPFSGRAAADNIIFVFIFRPTTMRHNFVECQSSLQSFASRCWLDVGAREPILGSLRPGLALASHVASHVASLVASHVASHVASLVASLVASHVASRVVSHVASF